MLCFLSECLYLFLLSESSSSWFMALTAQPRGWGKGISPTVSVNYTHSSAPWLLHSSSCLLWQTQGKWYNGMPYSMCTQGDGDIFHIIFARLVLQTFLREFWIYSLISNFTTKDDWISTRSYVLCQSKRKKEGKVWVTAWSSHPYASVQAQSIKFFWRQQQNSFDISSKNLIKGGILLWACATKWICITVTVSCNKKKRVVFEWNDSRKTSLSSCGVGYCANLLN